MYSTLMPEQIAKEFLKRSATTKNTKEDQNNEMVVVETTPFLFSCEL